MRRRGVVWGSNAGVSSRISGHQSAGTGGAIQWDGSLLSPLWAGMTRVPVGPRTARSASTTVRAPPITQPIFFIELWTIRVWPGPIPRAISESVI